MREGFFIRQNIEKWKKYQEESTTDPDETAKRFVEYIDDLAYAKTFYPESEIAKYLNERAAKIYLQIYATKKEKSSRITSFWKRELPLLIYKYRNTLLIALGLFILFAGMAVFSAQQNEDYIRGVLGERYIEMTEQNIEKGDPFAVYKSESKITMFLMIAYNNIYVLLRIFVAGFFLGLGTLNELFKNATMIGAFQYYFFTKGLGWESVLCIWLHGVLEISSLIVSSAAGFIIGTGILFPGSLSRKQSMLLHIRDGMKITIGIIPILMIAAFIEAYITRYAGMPVPIAVGLIGICASFIIWYFIIYPRQMYKTEQLNEKI